MSAGLPLMKNVLTPLAKGLLIQLGKTVSASATGAAIQKNKRKQNKNWIMYDRMNNFQRINGRYHENLVKIRVHW